MFCTVNQFKLQKNGVLISFMLKEDCKTMSTHKMRRYFKNGTDVPCMLLHKQKMCSMAVFYVKMREGSDKRCVYTVKAVPRLSIAVI